MAVASSDELTRTFGVLLIGFIFSVVLYGLTFFRTSAALSSAEALCSAGPSRIETYIYYTRFPADHMGTKWIVS